MSKENFAKFLQATAADQQLRQKFENAKTLEDVKNLAREQGYDLGDLSSEEAARTFDVVTGEIQKKELSEEELELVAGGLAHEHQNPAPAVNKLQRPKGIVAQYGHPG